MVEVPGSHSAFDNHRVKAVEVEPCGGTQSAPTGTADDVHVDIDGHVAVAWFEFTERNVVRTFNVSGFKLEVFTDVQENSVVWDFWNGNCWFAHTVSVASPVSGWADISLPHGAGITQ